jgi:hypothetical protein
VSLGIIFAGHWGDGNTSSSDLQRFRAGVELMLEGRLMLVNGTDPSVTVYTNISDQYAPYYTKLIKRRVNFFGGQEKIMPWLSFSPTGKECGSSTTLLEGRSSAGRVQTTRVV